jgi:hypothetical protein
VIRPAAYSARWPAFSGSAITTTWYRHGSLLPALAGGVLKKLETGAKVADVGCVTAGRPHGRGFPKIPVHRLRFPCGLDRGCAGNAQSHGVSANTRFEVGLAKDHPGKDFDLVACFDCLHDMGDPAGTALPRRPSI